MSDEVEEEAEGRSAAANEHNWPIGGVRRAPARWALPHHIASTQMRMRMQTGGRGRGETRDAMRYEETR